MQKHQNIQNGSVTQLNQDILVRKHDSKYMKKDKNKTVNILDENLKTLPAKPTKYPDWALEDIMQPDTGMFNVVEPPESRKNTGWFDYESANRQFFNYLQRHNSLWIRYFDYFATQVVNNIADLPGSPAICEGRVFYIKNTKKLCFSDGTSYQQFTTVPVGSV